MDNKLMENIVSLSKRRGFIFPACEIYGGFANSYTYGPYGIELKKNIKDMWWKMFVQDRADMVGIDGPIILHPKLWEASGHTDGFNDALVDCKNCNKRYRADHLVEEKTGEDLEGEIEKMTEVLKNEKILCPNCGKQDWTDIRTFNLMFAREPVVVPRRLAASSVVKNVFSIIVLFSFKKLLGKTLLIKECVKEPADILMLANKTTIYKIDNRV